MSGGTALAERPRELKFKLRAGRSVWLILRLAIGMGLLYYVLSGGGTGAAVRRLLGNIWLIPVLALQTLAGAVIESLRLRVLLRSQGVPLTLGYGYRLVAVASFFSLCIPGGTGGDVMKVYYLNSRHRGRGLEVATVLIIDRVVAMFALLVLLLTLASIEGTLLRSHPLIRILMTAAASLIAALLVFAALFCSRRIPVERFHHALPAWLPLRPYLVRISGAIRAFRDHKGALALAAGLSSIGHLLLVGMFMTAGSVMLPKTPALVVSVLSLVGMFANALPITPGGLGVGESAFEALFAMAGFSTGAFLMLSWRIGMIPLCIIGCLSYVAGLNSGSATAGASSAGPPAVEPLRSPEYGK